MAVTSIWAVTHHIDNTITYIVNPEKTIERPELSQEAIDARKAVGDVIDYASNGDKTDQMMYVTGINCSPDTAVEEFLCTKRYWGKTDGRLAYHGYQAFKEGDGEISAETAHKIGVELAQELWGDRFEVVIATHLNTGHLHNHFVVNSVSFIDGLKYRRTKADYRQMRAVSDRLCKEAKLHVVEDPSTKKGRSYDEWMMQRQGKTTVRGTIREDIDYAIKMSRTEKQFASIMKELGYEFKFFGKDGSRLEHPGLKPPDGKNFFRFRSLGTDYDLDSIRRRIILNTTVPGTPLLIEDKHLPHNISRPQGTGLASVYQRYCIRLYAIVCRPKRAKREYVPMALREDIDKLDKYIAQMDFLYEHKVDDTASLQAMRDSLVSQLKPLIMERRKLYAIKKKAVRNQYGPLITETDDKIRPISQKIRELRKQIAMCDAVSVSSERVAKGLEAPDRKPELEPPKKDIKTRKQYRH